MPMNLRLMAWISCGVAVAMMLGGCVRSNLRVIETPTPAITPLFATDAEALAAATKAYAAFQNIADQILHDGGRRSERIKAVANAAVSLSEMDGFRDYKKAGYRSEGLTAIDGIRLQSRANSISLAVEVVSVYLCLDVSTVQVANADGDSAVSPERPARTSFQIGFQRKNSTTRDLIVSSKEVWIGSTIC